jgi:hypothetical protein
LWEARILTAGNAAPNQIIISDITKWHDQLKIRDVTGRDWEGYYKKISENLDRETCASASTGAIISLRS